MPDITAAGTYTHETTDFEFLRFVAGESKVLLFDGALGGSAVSIKYTDDQGVDRTLEDGLVSALPMSKLIGPLGISVKIVVAGGTPNFNVSEGGKLRF